MDTSRAPADHAPREFRDADLSGARFVDTDLTGAVLRGVDVDGMEVDSPWLLEGGATLVVNGVDVAPLVEAELNRRFPGRETRRAADPQGLREAWEVLQGTWVATVARASAMPEGAVEQSVAGEWSFAQTLRHLVLATDLWLGHTVIGTERPFHPLGLANPRAGDEGLDMSVFTTDTPTFAAVLEARAGRVALVRDFIADVTAEQLAQPRTNPWSPDHPETVLSCLHTILEEEWEHHRYAVRDLDALATLDAVDTASTDVENGLVAPSMG
ncbi:DinB family protein [Intrasporangium sp. YIM S08009]|uniref:DinB family protein n=1 Tax=Intrasporangium zincisolvens TaxID=3080018 RepID=UPI002B0594F1|nr:DinB family protein [Intrasporangium sp. YIM S08009]